MATFYGGGKDGLVTKTEVNRYSHQIQNDYEDEDPGQCVVICKADAGVARVIATLVYMMEYQHKSCHHDSERRLFDLLYS